MPNEESRHTILLVEDDPDARDALAEGLRMAQKLPVDTASSAVEALSMARERPPAIAVLDVNLPDLPVTELVEELRRVTAARRLPLVLLSGSAGVGGLAAFLGTRFFLRKPAPLDRIVAMLHAAMADPPSGLSPVGAVS